MSNSVNLSLDVTKTGIQNPLIKVRQGDGGFETLRTTVTANGEPMDLQAWTITFMGTTAGNHKIVDGNVTLVEAPNGIFDYTPSKAWGMDIGDFKIAYFKFVKGDGSASSANFRVSVIEAVDLTQEEAQNYISVVDTTIAEINQHLTDSLATVTQSIADTNNNANTLTSNVNTLGKRVDDYNNKLAAIKVGGRNLLVGTASYTGVGWLRTGNINQSDFQGLASVSVTNAWSGPAYKNSYLEGQGKVTNTSDTYILTAWVNNTGTNPVTICFYSGEVTPQDYPVATLPANSGWVRIASRPFKFTKTTGLASTIRFESTSDVQGGVFKQVGLKLEIGNVPTDWTPAPEDVPSNDAQLVHKTGTETISGDKTFVGSTTFAGIATGGQVNLPASGDLNTLTDTGKYYQSTNVNVLNWSNRPSNAPNLPFAVDVIGHVSRSLATQMYYSYTTSRMWVRTLWNGGTSIASSPWVELANDSNVVHKTGNENIAGDKTFTGTVNAAQKIYTRTIGSTADLQIIYTRVGNVVTGRYTVAKSGVFTLSNNEGYKAPTAYPVNVIAQNINTWFTTDNRFAAPDGASQGNFMFITNDPFPAN